MESNFKSTGSGIATVIIRTLSKYRGTMPIDLLAKEVGRNTPEILDYLKKLESEEVLKIRGETVSLL